MTAFDPERFENKYVHYFPELQRAYKRAFNQMNEQFDSGLIHAIDQQVLNESEPFYEDDNANATFRIELPERPFDRLSGVVVGRSQFESVLEIYVSTLIRCLEEELLDESQEPKA